jgi:GNAT superfamily N-acetyltransferase
MPVRDARPEDLNLIGELIHELAAYEQAPEEVEFHPDVLAHHLFGPDPVAHVLIAETDEGEGAGFALYFRTFSTWVGRPGIWLEDLFVRPAARTQGLGRQMLDELRARTDGRVEWAVLDWNQLAIDFYERLGAKPVNGWTRYRW